jgi:dimeric dUTPase (all-alpha-NTP-PPase superfamily)
MLTSELYEIQRGLKARIGYDGPDKFSKMMLAMVIEFSEAANDWQGFKYWKKHNNPKVSLLEEFVDGLHFVLEAGLDLVEMEFMSKLPDEMEASTNPEKTINNQFKHLTWLALLLDAEARVERSLIKYRYYQLFSNFLSLGQMLGFKEDQIINAYKAKNRVNHARQDNGY